MSFYAVAIGRVQKVCTTWDECRRLTQGYPHNNFKRFNTYEAAEQYIKEVNEELKNKKSFNFETPLNLHCFINNEGRPETFKTKIYLSMKTHVTRQDQCSSVTAVISTLKELKMEILNNQTLKSGDSRINNYILNEVNNNPGNLNSLILLIRSLNYLIDSEIKTFDLITDSRYIASILTKDATKINPMTYGELNNFDKIVELYSLLSNFNRVPITYVPYKSMPNRLKIANMSNILKLKEFLYKNKTKIFN